MSRITYEICDRCGHRVGRAFPIARFSRFKVVMMFGVGPYNGAESEYVLCEDCTRMFVKFIRPPKDEVAP